MFWGVCYLIEHFNLLTYLLLFLNYYYMFNPGFIKDIRGDLMFFLVEILEENFSYF